MGFSSYFVRRKRHKNGQNKVSFDCAGVPVIKRIVQNMRQGGVLGCAIIGAGLGRCVIALARKDKAGEIISIVNRECYDTYGSVHGASTA